MKHEIQNRIEEINDYLHRRDLDDDIVARLIEEKEELADKQAYLPTDEKAYFRTELWFNEKDGRFYINNRELHCGNGIIAYDPNRDEFVNSRVEMDGDEYFYVGIFDREKRQSRRLHVGDPVLTRGEIYEPN